MPGFPLIQGFTEARLSRGLDAGEVKELKAFVLDGRMEPNELQAEQLLRVTALYADYFTGPAAKAWRELTGIDVGTAETTWRKSAKLYKNVLEARIDIGSERARILKAHPVEKRGNSIVVSSPVVNVDDIAARKPGAPKPASLSLDDAVKLDMTSALVLRGLEDPHSALVKDLCKQLAVAEREIDGDGRIVPRDLPRLPEPLNLVMEEVWKDAGKKSLDIDNDIRPRLPAALNALVHAGPRRENRVKPPTADLYRRAVEDAAGFLARTVQNDVVRGDKPMTLVLEANGITKPAQKGTVLRLLNDLTPPPTLSEIAGLYARAAAKKLLVRDFYNAARLDQYQVFQLQAAHPDLFPRDATMKHTTALPAPRRADAAEPTSKLERVDDMAKAWAKEVMTGKSTVEQFASDHGLRLNVLRRLRKVNAARFPDPPRSSNTADRAAAEKFAAAMVAAGKENIFADVKALVEIVNKTEKALVKEYGAFTYYRYYDFRRKSPDLFGRADDSSRWQEPVKAKMAEMLAKDPSLSRKDLVVKLQKIWPEVTYSRLSHIKETDASAALPGSYNRRSAADIDAMATRMREMMDADPSISNTEMAKVLSKERKEDVERAYVASIIRDFRPAMFNNVASVDDARLAPLRQSLPAHGLLQLAIRTCPPGTKVENILAVLNDMLEERGVGKLEPQYLPRLQQLAEAKGFEGPSQVHARMTAQIVAEYARAAKPGTSEADILAAVSRDYPTLGGRALGRYRGEWRANPTKFPELAPFAVRGQRGEFAFSGRGETLKDPPGARFIGGFDLDRQLRTAPKDEKLAMARLSELAEIPLRLPEIDAVVADLKGGTPLKQSNVLWVSHLLGDVVPMGFALKEAGAVPGRTIVVGTPYGTNASVKQCLEDIGYSVRKPSLDVDDYKKQVKKAIDDVIAQHKKNGEPIVVMDDGGLVSSILHEDPKYAPFRKKFRIVEQTTGGVLLAEKHALESVVVNVARSESKALEGEAIGEVVAAKIVQSLTRFDRFGEQGVKGKRFVLHGYGVVGEHIAREMAARGAIVTIVDRNAKACEAARKAGYEAVQNDPTDPKAVEARKRVLKSADLVVGATGGQTLTYEDMLLLKDGCAVASASSKRVEMEMAKLEKEHGKGETLENEEPLLALPNKRYRVKGKDLFVIGDGFPVNFDGGVQSVPPHKIQLTDAAMLAALFQAARIGGTKSGLVPLDPEVDRRLLERHHALEKARADAKTPPSQVYDPTKWRETIVAVGKRHAATSSNTSDD